MVSHDGNEEHGWEVTYLVTVAPRVVPGANVLERVFDALLERGHVGPVLPVIVPEVVGVEAGEEEGRGDGAGKDGVSIELLLLLMLLVLFPELP